MYYDDNFGAWDMDGDREERQNFYRYVQRNSVTKTCADCGRKVRIMPHYAVCNSCADARERGYVATFSWRRRDKTDRYRMFYHAARYKGSRPLGLRVLLQISFVTVYVATRHMANHLLDLRYEHYRLHPDSLCLL